MGTAKVVPSLTFVTLTSCVTGRDFMAAFEATTARYEKESWGRFKEEEFARVEGKLK